MRHRLYDRSALLLLALAAPLVAGCSSGADLLSRDAEWFSRPGRVFTRSISIETPPLTPDKPVGPDDLITADGVCPGMAPPVNSTAANALSDASAAPESRPGVVALGHTECDVARGAGAPDSVSLSNNERGDRVALLTYSRGPRAGIYTFTAGRLTSIERGPDQGPQPKAAKPKTKKRAAG